MSGGIETYHCNEHRVSIEAEKKTVNANRVVFAEVLRAFAAPLVVVAHYCELYLYHQDYVSKVSLISIDPVQAPVWIRTVIFHTVNFGALGVALFFLISGFVIPMSLDRYGGRSFVITRFFRLYPAYFVALIVSSGVLGLSSHVFGAPWPFSLWDIGANLAIMPDVFGTQAIVGTVWTLLIEIKFYILVGIFVSFIRRGSIKFLLAVAFSIFVAQGLLWARCHGQADACWGEFSIHYLMMSWEFDYLIFMMIGVVFYYHFRKKASTKACILAGGLFMTLFAVTWSLNEPYERIVSNPSTTYLAALGIFWISYVRRSRFRTVPIVSFMADISYTLYLLHMYLGFVALRLLSLAGVPYLVGLPVVVAGVVGASWLLTVWVEKPFIAVGKRLVRGADARGPVAPAGVASLPVRSEA